MKSRLKPLAVLLTVFLLGSIAGAAASRTYMLHEMRARFDGPPNTVRAHLRIEALRRQLDLTTTQVEQIEAIFKETDGELEKQTAPCRSGVESLRKKTDERIESLLTPDQKTRFTKFREHRHKHPFPRPE